MNRIEFVKSLKPVAPFQDWRIYSLLIPAAFSAVGFFVFAVLGYSFTEFSSIPSTARFWLVVLGGVCLAIGGEIGTLTSTVEVYRKEKLGRVVLWDWIALGISLITTLSSFVLAFAALLGERASWSQPVQTWGAIFLGALSALDAYGLFLETGYLFADYEQRMDAWFSQMEQEEKNLPIDVGELGKMQKQLEILRQELEVLQYPLATFQIWRDKIVPGLNGQGKKLLAGGCNMREVVNAACKTAGYRFPVELSDSTVGNWAKLLREAGK